MILTLILSFTSPSPSPLQLLDALLLFLLMLLPVPLHSPNACPCSITLTPSSSPLLHVLSHPLPSLHHYSYIYSLSYTLISFSSPSSTLSSTPFSPSLLLHLLSLLHPHLLLLFYIYPLFYFLFFKQKAGVPIKRLTVNPNRAVSVGSVAAGYLIAHPDCRGWAKCSEFWYVSVIWYCWVVQYTSLYHDKLTILLSFHAIITFHLLVLENATSECLITTIMCPDSSLTPYFPLYNTVWHRLAKKSFTGYLRSLQLLPGKLQQDVTKLPLDAFAISLGLGMTPEAPVAPQGAEEREGVREKKNINR